MDPIGKTYLFDCGEVVLSITYLSDQKLAWKYAKGPDVGRSDEEDYASFVVRPGVYFMWWQEKDTSVITQVVDFERMVVHTTHISPENEVSAFQGVIRPVDS